MTVTSDGEKQMILKKNSVRVGEQKLLIIRSDSSYVLVILPNV